MLGFPLLSDSFRHPVQLPAGGLDLALRLFLLRAIHLSYSPCEAAVGALQNSDGHRQVTLHLFDRRRLGCRRLPLRFQEQFRLGEYALANQARALPPGRIKLCRLPCVAVILHESGRHSFALLRIDSRDRRQILHRHLRRDLALAHLPLDRFRQQLHQR
jgi:hypothetical protein